jgi:hypothetical protein
MPNQVGTHTLFVVAHSSISGQEATLSVPFSIKR